jgi:putative acetyltransferase
MVRIRQEKKKDYESVSKLITEAFKRDDEAKLVESIRNSEVFIPELSLVAENNESIIGHILFSPVVIEKEESIVPALALAPLAVEPSYQGQGVGGQLVKEGLKVCKEFNHKIVIVLGHSAYYPKFGFVKAADYGIEPPFPVPLDVFMVKGLQKDALDNVRGLVRYPSVFNEV